MEHAIEIPWYLTGHEDPAAVEARVRSVAQEQFPKPKGYDHATLTVRAPHHDQPLTHPNWTALRRYRAPCERSGA